MSATFAQLERAIASYPAKERARIIRAYEIAKSAHAGQKRATGEPYISHPLSSALSIARLQLDANTICASLLHDAIEDCDLSPDIILKEFGQDVLFLVESVSKLGNVRYSKVQRHVEALRRMFLATAQDVRVVIIKLYDRLHNMQTLGAVRAEKRARIAQETLELFAPLSYRLGIGGLKGQLEDLAFPYVYPKDYEWVRREVKDRLSARERYLKRLLPHVRDALANEKVKVVDVHVRAKHYYSLWRKLLKHNMDFSQVYDLAAIRIVVESVEDCYAALGVIHTHYRPLPGRIKDYIALPKPNGYRSLHTTIFANEDRIVEVQIRTKEMHEEAELGVAAHWAYDAGGKKKLDTKKVKQHESELIKRLQEWQTHFADDDSEEYLESLKIDVFKDRIFIFTPKGEVIDLPDGSTPVDFAYHIHSEIGNRMTGAKAGGKMVPFDYELRSGETVEILTGKERKPSLELLELAHTSLAKSHIRATLKRSGVVLPRTSKGRPPMMYEVAVRGENRVGLLRDLSTVFAREHINIIDHSTHADVKTYHQIIFRFEVKNRKTLLSLVAALGKLKGVVEVAHKHVATRD